MAATVVSARALVAAAGSEFISEVKLSGLTAGLVENVAHQGPSGCTPDAVELMVTAPPTDGSDVRMSVGATNTSANTTAVRFDVQAGGDLTGATVTLRFKFLDQGTGGLQTITTV